MSPNNTKDCFGQDINIGDYVIFTYYDSMTIGRLFRFTEQKAFVVAVPNISKCEKWQPFATNTYKHNVFKCDRELAEQYKLLFDEATIKVIPTLQDITI